MYSTLFRRIIPLFAFTTAAPSALSFPTPPPPPPVLDPALEALGPPAESDGGEPSFLSAPGQASRGEDGSSDGVRGLAFVPGGEVPPVGPPVLGEGFVCVGVGPPTSNIHSGISVASSLIFSLILSLRLLSTAL
ncbi:hypothetical protein BDZ94DRAFT_1269392 [Collybia nuda]|uniref:Uncharacterized protein n=1 Tax=Collybia nuda TaxID=64659 RepID=A0A9P5Y078_9AGAR|nr:hypothetical protein BDZ94DRAFT_1269392 [Collybia nuda]